MAWGVSWPAISHSVRTFTCEFITLRQAGDRRNSGEEDGVEALRHLSYAFFHERRVLHACEHCEVRWPLSSIISNPSGFGLPIFFRSATYSQRTENSHIGGLRPRWGGSLERVQVHQADRLFYHQGLPDYRWSTKYGALVPGWYDGNFFRSTGLLFRMRVPFCVEDVIQSARMRYHDS